MERLERIREIPTKVDLASQIHKGRKQFGHLEVSREISKYLQKTEQIFTVAICQLARRVTDTGWQLARCGGVEKYEFLGFQGFDQMMTPA